MQYTVYDFVTVESDILQHGEWRRNQPTTPHFFMHAIFNLCAMHHDEVSVHTTALLEQCLQQDTLVLFCSSKPAVACILIALRRCNLDTVYLHKLIASVQKPQRFRIRKKDTLHHTAFYFQKHPKHGIRTPTFLCFHTSMASTSHPPPSLLLLLVLVSPPEIQEFSLS